jgi:beta-RFAP synthase
MPSLTIITGARLHFGLLVRGQGAARSYGGIGVMIDRPGFTMTLRRADQVRVQATPGTKRRIERYLAEWGGDSQADIIVRQEIPAHAGLGSGTQLGCALAGAIRRLNGEPPVDAQQLAQRVGRAQRSVIGTVGFEAGGLIAHGFSSPRNGNAEIRRDFPTNWRFVLVTPRDSIGISGPAESAAFRDLPPMTDSRLTRLEKLANEMLAACEAGDSAATSDRLSEYGSLVGEYFAPVQGGVFADARMADLAGKLRSAEIHGVGQTSWGPTLFVLCESGLQAASLAAKIPEWGFGDCAIQIAAAKNDGARFSASVAAD